jgi:hypothetical protein
MRSSFLPYRTRWVSIDRRGRRRPVRQGAGWSHCRFRHWFIAKVIRKVIERVLNNIKLDASVARADLGGRPTGRSRDRSRSSLKEIAAIR